MEIEAKVGDIVHIRAEVIDTQSGHTGHPGVKIQMYRGSIWAQNSEVVHVEPKPIKVGDTVRRNYVDFRVMAVDGDGKYLWIKLLADHHHDVCPVSVHRHEVEYPILR
jgi:hypothetical protein